MLYHPQLFIHKGIVNIFTVSEKAVHFKEALIGIVNDSNFVKKVYNLLRPI